MTTATPRLTMPSAPGAVLTFRPGNPAGVREIITSDGSNVEHRLIGPAAAIPAAIDSLLQDYDPIGYGTRVISERQFEGGATSVVILRRAASCD